MAPLHLPCYRVISDNSFEGGVPAAWSNYSASLKDL